MCIVASCWTLIDTVAMTLIFNIQIIFYKDYVDILTICPPIKLLTLNASHSLFISIWKKTKHRVHTAAILLLVQGRASDDASVTPISIVRLSAMLLLAVVGDWKNEFRLASGGKRWIKCVIEICLSTFQIKHVDNHS